MLMIRKLSWQFVFFSLSFVICLLLYSCRGETKPSVLKTIEKELKSEFADLNSSFSYKLVSKGKTLIVRYKTRKFTLHEFYRGGEMREGIVEVEGPAYDGFLLKIKEYPQGYLRQQGLRLYRRGPYWYVYPGKYPASDPDFYYVITLYFRRGTDRKIIEKLAKVLKAPKLIDMYNYAQNNVDKIRTNHE